MGFELMTYRFGVNDLTHCATCKETILDKEKKYNIMLNVIVYFYWIFDTLLRCPFHLKEKVQFFNLVSLYAQHLQATQNVLQVLL